LLETQGAAQRNAATDPVAAKAGWGRKRDNPDSQGRLRSGREIFNAGRGREHYDGHFKLQLTADQKRELIEYLKSL